MDLSVGPTVCVGGQLIFQVPWALSGNYQTVLALIWRVCETTSHQVGHGGDCCRTGAVGQSAIYNVTSMGTWVSTEYQRWRYIPPNDAPSWWELSEQTTLAQLPPHLLDLVPPSDEDCKPVGKLTGAPMHTSRCSRIERDSKYHHWEYRTVDSSAEYCVSYMRLTRWRLRSSTQPRSYSSITVAWGGNNDKTLLRRATAYFCCSPGVSILAKNKGMSWQQTIDIRPLSSKSLAQLFWFPFTAKCNPSHASMASSGTFGALFLSFCDLAAAMCLLTASTSSLLRKNLRS